MRRIEYSCTVLAFLISVGCVVSQTPGKMVQFPLMECSNSKISPVWFTMDTVSTAVSATIGVSAEALFTDTRRQEYPIGIEWSWVKLPAEPNMKTSAIAECQKDVTNIGGTDQTAIWPSQQYAA